MYKIIMYISTEDVFLLISLNGKFSFIPDTMEFFAEKVS